MNKEINEKIDRIKKDIDDLVDYSEEDIIPEEKEMLRFKAEQLRHKMKKARDRADSAKRSVEEYTKENPWQSIGISMAVGATLMGIIIALRNKDER